MLAELLQIVLKIGLNKIGDKLRIQVKNLVNVSQTKSVKMEKDHHHGGHKTRKSKLIDPQYRLLKVTGT